MDDVGTIRRTLPRELRRDLVVCPDAIQVARVAAFRFVEAARQLIVREGSFRVALAGGNTPRELYRVLGTSEFCKQADWAKVHLFWGDERAVPPDHSDSNFGLVRRELLSRIPIPPGNVHRMEAERPQPEVAVEHYERLLRQYLHLDSRGLPRFHLIFLGIGLDGHTASLFPGSQTLHETSHWVAVTVVPTLGSRRMTLTLPVLNAAHQVFFLVTGAEKAEILRTVLSGTSTPQLPAQRVTVPHGLRRFLVDEAAAALVRGEGSSRSA